MRLMIGEELLHTGEIEGVYGYCSTELNFIGQILSKSTPPRTKNLEAVLVGRD